MTQPLTLIQLFMKADEGTLIGAFDVANDDYHAGPGISSSDIKKAGKSLKKWAHAKKNPEEKSDALIVGNMFHTLVREPWLFDKEYIIKPEGVRAGTVKYEALAKEAKGRQIVSARLHEEAQELANSVLRSPRALSYSMGAVEKAFYWIDPETGLLCKCRTDTVNFKKGSIADYKSTKDASYEGFMYEVRKHGYGLSNAWYVEGVNLALEQAPNPELNPTGAIIENFIFVAVEKEAPYEIGFYDLPPEFIDNCREKCHEILRSIAVAMKTNTFPGYSEKVQTLQPKSYQFYNVNYEEEVA